MKRVICRLQCNFHAWEYYIEFTSYLTNLTLIIATKSDEVEKRDVMVQWELCGEIHFHVALSCLPDAFENCMHAENDGIL